MNIDEILVCITNHNDNENALKLKKMFSKHFETIIIDSKSDEVLNEFDIKLENVYYTGLFNESVNQCKIRNKKYLYFIASDVSYDNVDFDKLINIISNLNEDIYLWNPSSEGQSHYHCKNFKTDGMRDVPYLEGFNFLVNMKCCDFVYPVNMTENKFGYGIDLLLGFNCIKNLKKKCIIDDRILVHHREGTGYDKTKALQDMYKWMMSFDDEVKKYTILYNKSWLSEINSSDYKKLLNYLKN